MKYTSSGEGLVSFMDFAAAKRMKWLLSAVSPTPISYGSWWDITLRWRHNERDGVSNRRRPDV